MDHDAEFGTVPTESRTAPGDSQAPPTESGSVTGRCVPLGRSGRADVRVEPLPRLEWSLAVESAPPVNGVAAGRLSPDALRNGWVHRTPEHRVLSLYRRLNASPGALPAPWWLTALDREEIPSRAAAFALEDDVHALLTSRPGWVFVPWGNTVEAGYWEYAPSDREPVTTPTTVTMTDRHPGWVNVQPAHTDPATALPMPVRGVAGLAAELPRIESW